MGVIKSFVTKTKFLFGLAKENAPLILQGASATGTILAVVFTAEAAPKALELIKKAEEEKGDKLTFKEKVKACGKVYIKPGVVTVVAIGSGIAATGCSLKRQAKLAAALATTDMLFSEYQDKVKEIVGEKKEKEVRDALAIDEAKAKGYLEDGTEPYPTRGGDDIFIDMWTGTKFKSSVTALDQACLTIAERLVGGEMFISLNELRYEMGLGNATVGDDCFFTPDNIPKFSYTYQEGNPCILVDFAPGHNPKMNIKNLYR